MDVRIGLVHNAREIELELPDDTDAEKLRASVEQALADSASVLWVTDKKGRSTGVIVDKLAWIEIGAETGRSRIGFGS
ncbi:MAG: DUF3107 domain-containing protein [Acidimicrobiales bacterium]